MATQLLFPDNIDQSLTAGLGNYQYVFTVYYNASIDRWVIDCKDGYTAEPLVTGCILNLGVDVFEHLSLARGSLIMYDRGDHVEITKDKLIYSNLLWFEPSTGSYLYNDLTPEVIYP